MDGPAWESLVECVPNVSEGRDQATLDALATAVEEQAGAWLLDRTADVDHGRSVYTMAGHPAPVMAAMEAMVGIAVERVDMRAHRGRHPCIGAVDVIPFVPLGDSTMEQCVAGALAFAERIAERFGLPVYLYREAALRPDRQVLADIRRPGFEGLAEAMARPGGAPDFGPAVPHPTAGASVVGARPFLIAFNIQLSTTDLRVARRLAGRMRERDGGLPAVQALGIDLPSQGCTQLSMNVLDHRRTPLWRVWQEAEGLAADEGVSLTDSELIGLLPARALADVADHIGVPASDPAERRFLDAAGYLRMRDFEPGRVLELRLAQARARD
jgi:glutamate formiminotransferase